MLHITKYMFICLCACTHTQAHTHIHKQKTSIGEDVKELEPLCYVGGNVE